MAIIYVTPGVKYKATATNQYVLGNGSDENIVGSYTVHLADGGSFTGSVVPQIRSSAFIAQGGSTSTSPGQTATNDDLAFVNSTYYNEATGLYATATIAAVPAVITMRASGWTCALNCTVSTGSLLIYVQRVLGASA